MVMLATILSRTAVFSSVALKCKNQNIHDCDFAYFKICIFYQIESIFKYDIVTIPGG
jgi:hypothetical protein